MFESNNLFILIRRGRFFGMKKTIITILCLILGLFCLLPEQPADAAKKTASKKPTISKEEMNFLVTSVDEYTRKVYANSLFSPKDIEKIIEIKLKLDTQMLVSADPEFAPLYYKMANIYKSREYNDDAIDCYQTILENFPDTAFYPKAKRNLEKMGIEVEEPLKELPEEISE